VSGTTDDGMGIRPGSETSVDMDRSAFDVTDPVGLGVERSLWTELTTLLRELREDEILTPGYYLEDWSAKDMLAHIGTWLAEAGVVLEQIRFGTYRSEEIDVDEMNARFLAAMRDVPMPDVWIQAHASRTRMLAAWAVLPGHTDGAAFWVRKAGPDHYTEHLPRLRFWVEELVARRTGTFESPGR
jgi:hypothetical protein